MVLAEVAKSGDAAAYPGLARERLAETTGFFVDLVVGRLLMRAIFGEDLKELRTEAKRATSTKREVLSCRLPQSGKGRLN